MEASDREALYMILQRSGRLEIERVVRQFVHCTTDDEVQAVIDTGNREPDPDTKEEA